MDMDTEDNAAEQSGASKNERQPAQQASTDEAAGKTGADGFLALGGGVSIAVSLGFDRVVRAGRAIRRRLEPAARNGGHAVYRASALAVKTALRFAWSTSRGAWAVTASVAEQAARVTGDGADRLGKQMNVFTGNLAQYSRSGSRRAMSYFGDVAMRTGRAARAAAIYAGQTSGSCARWCAGHAKSGAVIMGQATLRWCKSAAWWAQSGAVAAGRAAGRCCIWLGRCARTIALATWRGTLNCGRWTARRTMAAAVSAAKTVQAVCAAIARAALAIWRAVANMCAKILSWWRRANKLRLAGATLYVVLGCVAVFAAQVIYLHASMMPDVHALATYQPQQSIRIYDRYDKLAAVVPVGDDRQAIPLDQVSQWMQKAMLASEDHKFYHHDGVNLISIMRAAMANLQAGRVVEGGSTITQQLAKNVFFPNEPRTVDCKLKELLLALDIENRFPKEKILEMYLNQVYFGRQAYGIERAAQRYFNKPASKLNLAESAFLAGVVKAPSVMASRKNRSQAIQRQHHVLEKMVEYEFATREQVEAAKKEKLAFRDFIDPYERYPHYLSHVMELLRQRFDKKTLNEGLLVYTNLDQDAQIAAERAMENGIKRAPPGVSQGALVSINLADGAVIAMVGGVGEFYKNQFNRATSGHTAGSAFKPFVYMAAFMAGVDPDTIVPDSPITISNQWTSWSPRNFDGRFYGPMTVREALAKSRNVCAVYMAKKVGIQKVIETARKAGVKRSRLDPFYPLALGASAVSPLEMAAGYFTFARNGVAIEPQVLRRIEDNHGKVLAVFRSKPEQVFPPKDTYKLVDVLITAVERGTGTRARLKDRQVAGKTGTADGNRDIWFVGFTTDIVTAVWGGNDENRPIGGRSVTGGVVMAGMWKEYTERYYRKHNLPIARFQKPKDVQIASADGKDEGKAKAEDAAAGNKKKLKPQSAGGDTAVAAGEQNAGEQGESVKPSRRRGLAQSPPRKPERVVTVETTTESSPSGEQPSPDRTIEQRSGQAGDLTGERPHSSHDTVERGLVEPEGSAPDRHQGTASPEMPEPHMPGAVRYRIPAAGEPAVPGTIRMGTPSRIRLPVPAHQHAPGVIRLQAPVVHPISPVAPHAGAQPSVQPVSPATVQPVSPPVTQPVSPVNLQPASTHVVQPASPATVQPVAPVTVHPASPATVQSAPAAGQPTPAATEPAASRTE